MVFIKEQLDLLLGEIVNDYDIMDDVLDTPEIITDDRDLSVVFNYIDTMSMEDYLNSIPQF